MSEGKVALITGGAKRVGASIACVLHARGMRVIIHYHHSEHEAKQLCERLNQDRPESAVCIQANLQHSAYIPELITLAIQTWGRLDVLINNAAVFQPSPLESLNPEKWSNTLNSNLTAPLFLSIEAAPYLKKTQGCIVNMVDIRANQPLKGYAHYCISKAGLVMATKSLALEWAPDIRVNAIAPGVALWSDAESEMMQKKIINRTPLKRAGTPEDIAKGVCFLIEDASYMTGQVLTIDGGRSLAY
jgi:pteridine reductase